MIKSIIYKLKYILDDFKKYSYIIKWYKKKKRKGAEKRLNKFLNQNQECSLYIGMPGAGKTTYISYIVHLCNICEYPVYCNVPIHGALPYSKDDIGRYDMSNALILLDEAGMVYDNRMYASDKQFTEESLRFLKLIRHYRSNIALFSQSLDIDIKWVRMSKTIFFVKQSIIPNFTSLIKIKRTLDVNPDTHKIEDFYDKPKNIITLLFHFRFWRKPYYKYFDSWDAPKLKPFPKLDKYKPYKMHIGE